MFTFHFVFSTNFELTTVAYHVRYGWTHIWRDCDYKWLTWITTRHRLVSTNSCEHRVKPNIPYTDALHGMMPASKWIVCYEVLFHTVTYTGPTTDQKLPLPHSHARWFWMEAMLAPTRGQHCWLPCGAQKSPFLEHSVLRFLGAMGGKMQMEVPCCWLNT